MYDIQVHSSLARAIPINELVCLFFFDWKDIFDSIDKVLVASELEGNLLFWFIQAVRNFLGSSCCQILRFYQVMSLFFLWYMHWCSGCIGVLWPLCFLCIFFLRLGSSLCLGFGGWHYGGRMSYVITTLMILTSPATRSECFEAKSQWIRTMTLCVRKTGNLKKCWRTKDVWGSHTNTASATGADALIR